MSDDAQSRDGSGWRGRGVDVADVEAGLYGLQRAHQREGHALARALNLIVAPGPPGGDAQIDATLAKLGAHSPSRAIVLRRHSSSRLDAEAMIECEPAGGPGGLGACHDRVTLTVDDRRLSHAASLVAPLLLSDLVTVLWLPAPESRIADPQLLERVQQVVIDSAGASIGPIADLARRARVHDLAWGRLEFWRAATAAAFQDADRRLLLPRVDALEIAHAAGDASASSLLCGWIAGRSGWRPERLEVQEGTAIRSDGARVRLSLRPDPEAGECGGIERVTFRAGEQRVEVRRGAATSRLRDLFAEALRPLTSYSRGYLEAVTIAAALRGAEA